MDAERVEVFPQETCAFITHSKQMLRAMTVHVEQNLLINE